MLKLKKSNVFFIFIILFFLTFLFLGRAFPSIKPRSKKNELKINSLDMSKDIFFRQSLNNCGAYSVMAVINILKKEKVDPELLAKKMTWRTYKNLTLPQGLIDLLHKNQIETKEHILYLLSDKEKINWLKSCIDNQKPVILLVKVHGIRHFFTILGYDENGFMIYDSLQEKNKENPRKTIVDNARYAGHRYYLSGDLISLWNKGRFKIFYNNWALTCTLPS